MEKKSLQDYEIETMYKCGNILENKWFEDHEKEKYSIKDIKEYIYSINPFLSESMEKANGYVNDFDTTIEKNLTQKIRRTMAKEFALDKDNKGHYIYEVDEAHVKYLVNQLLSKYLDGMVFKDVEDRMLKEAVEKFYKSIME